MNTNKTKPETRGRPKIYATASDRHRANNLRKKELHPEKYKEHGSQKMPPRYCDVCDKYCEYHAYNKHLYRRNHLKALAKKMEEHIENSTILEDNLISFNEKLIQTPIAC